MTANAHLNEISDKGKLEEIIISPIFKNKIKPANHTKSSKEKRKSPFLSIVPKDRKFKNPLALARASLIVKDYCKKGIYKETDKGKLYRLYNEYEKNNASTSFILYELRDGLIDPFATVTWTVGPFHKMPSYINGLWRLEDIEQMRIEKGSALLGTVAEINRFATRPTESGNSYVNVMRVYGSTFTRIKKETDHIFISTDERNAKTYESLELADILWETEHNSDYVGGKSVVVGHISLLDMENSKIHNLLRRHAVKETSKEYFV